ncbi:flagellar assembly peptidoglycan hydrolase FlgJ [Chromobacterium vaccinii]|uniref:flagellar assembly peptidoglycan hydrolase FlgJ n=1 Tax=Chromobacterium vaccinii TaxID=1108595 RepID=UPI001E3679A7|nr:flagellar assembly peptidoglycan hydrolase FlgJ [Chromobacterium vaccinii]MCD4500913.1 flagellar assembly peptidoglycan hydrolase FlgJ [Chromobacterium vaccinii]
MFTQRSESWQAAGAAVSSDAVALPLSLPSEGAGFSEQFAGVRAEVERFIAAGEPGSAQQLSPEAWRVQQQLRAGAADFSAVPRDRQGFVEEMLPHAQAAAARLGVTPDLVLAHAALESGWGRKPLTRSDGGNSHNLFGIKADARWGGEVATALTTEFIHGQKQNRVEPFRSYPDYRAAFNDYADLLASNPRYRAALGVGGDAKAFAEALARGGYATDPEYAGKLAGLAGQFRKSIR